MTDFVFSVVVCVSAAPFVADDASEVLQKAKRLIDSLKYEQAVEELTAGIRLAPNSADAHYLRAVAYWGLADSEHAAQDLGSAIRLDSRHSKALALRGEINYYGKRNREALSDLTAAIGLAPSDAQARIRRAAVYYDMGEYANAAGDYSEAIRIDPKDAKAHGSLAHMLAGVPLPEMIATSSR
jgi:tetratricopeptide (TPR) repeat protein